MFRTVFMLCLVGVAFARPDGDYNYQRPSFNGFSPSTQPSSGYVAGSAPDVAVQPSASYIPQNSQPLNEVPYNGPNSLSQFSAPSGGYLPGGGYSGKVENYNSYPSQDQKQVFFFAAPDEDEQQRLRIQVAPNTMKSTKIIFVKAPTYKVEPEVISPPPQGEDRTLVYVLVKKPQQSGSITIPSALGVKQAKPEVFYVKYRNQQEAERAVSESLGGHSHGSNLPDLGNQQIFLRSLQENSQRNGGNDINGFNDNGDILLGSSAPLVNGNVGSAEGATPAPPGPGAAPNAHYGPPAESGPY